MPTYEAQCTACNTRHDYFVPICSRDDAPLCPRCGATSLRTFDHPPVVHGDLNDFSTENGGKGRYNKQLRQYVTSVDDAISKAAKRGWTVLDKA